MKRKPMLINKIKDHSNGKGREVIGLIGTHHGTGVTHTGLMLAFYMGEELGKKTALLECNQHRDMRLIQNAYEWACEDDKSFSYQRITCYSEVTPHQVLEVLGEDYDCLILDFGTELIANKEEFLRCSIKIVIGGRSEWDISKLVLFTEAARAYRGSDSWLYFIPQATEKTAKKVSKEIGHKVLPVPMNEEPTLLSNISNRFFAKIFLA